jgi:hypothetical protein
VECFFLIIKRKTIGKRPLGEPMLSWKDNIRIDLKEIGIDVTNFVDSA